MSLCHNLGSACRREQNESCSETKIKKIFTEELKVIRETLERRLSQDSLARSLRRSKRKKPTEKIRMTKIVFNKSRVLEM